MFPPGQMLVWVAVDEKAGATVTFCVEAYSVTSVRGQPCQRSRRQKTRRRGIRRTIVQEKKFNDFGQTPNAGDIRRWIQIQCAGRSRFDDLDNLGVSAGIA